jgi:hypothetical protein
MSEKLLSKSLGTLLVVVFTVITMHLVRADALTQDSALRDVTYTLTRLPENPKQYSLVLSDPDERSISGIFSVDQLQILRVIMTEAEKFALSEEAVGAREPIITRFADKQERAFLVDVEKLGNQSRLFVTINSEIGRMTADAGRINRSIRREEGFFFDLLSRLRSVLPKPAVQSSK